MLDKGCSPNEANASGELPLARVLAAATAPTYDNDSAVFDMLIGAGADMAAAGETANPLLAICKNNLSKFAEMAVGVLRHRSGGSLDWDRRDDKGYTPLALAAYWDNAWLIRHLVDEVGVDPNAPAQRSRPTEPEVVGTTGLLCMAKPLTVPGTVEGQTPLMCACKGGSIGAVMLLLNRGADVRAVDAQGRTPLQHAMTLDKGASLKIAAALLQRGAVPGHGVQSPPAQEGAGGQPSWKPCVDLVGESWAHRAVRYGSSAFLELWAAAGGSLDFLATTADDADDMPGAELKIEEKGDFLDYVPPRVDNPLEEEDEELKAQPQPGEVDPESGQPRAQSGGGGGEGGAEGAGDDTGPDQQRGSGSGSGRPLGEGVEAGGPGVAQGAASDDDDCGSDVEAELAALIAAGEVESHYAGPSPAMLLRWRRRGVQWWEEFFVDEGSLPDSELEDEPGWADKYEPCEEGEEGIDEEDVEDEIWESIREEQRQAAIAYRRHQRDQSQREAAEAAREAAAAVTQRLGDPGFSRSLSQGLAHRLFKHRLPHAAVPPQDDGGGAAGERRGSGGGADAGSGFASGSPSRWLRQRSGSQPSSPAAPGGSRSPSWKNPFAGMFSRGGAGGGEGQAAPGSPLASPARPRKERSPGTARAGPGPVAEALEDEDDDDDKEEGEKEEEEGDKLELEDLGADDDDLTDAPRPPAPAPGPGLAGAASKRVSLAATQQQSAPAAPRLITVGSRPSRASKTSASECGGSTSNGGGGSSEGGGGGSEAGAGEGGERGGAAVMRGGPSRSMRAASRVASRAASEHRSKSFTAGLLGGLTSGTKGDRLYANEPYYQPGTRYNGLPRYMAVDVEAHPGAKYEGHLAAWRGRLEALGGVGGGRIKEERRLEGADLRARNIAWYNKSMSPVEFPLKQGKWKSFLRLSAKAVEAAKKRRPCKPGQKPKPRKKTAWFGLPDLPSRPELAQTSPLVYAVRLWRPKCVAVLLKYSAAAPNLPDAHGLTPLAYAMFLLANWSARGLRRRTTTGN
ncbi:hypothetical protein HYH03_005857 [Edaphochlamys debaryana]|uniref:Uncharacterized protein n=1 Tax=Edaphochlamys debaryana TaxID=47281 RepID=A0A836C0N7_9CHLO|nr:hypothetical protein HYH03_005857 [Edaphochlamys debaryana]|eukprot:KAG2495925.1 hypothetical protein HYH03_005857 [Edaphochlamys debaryana]